MIIKTDIPTPAPVFVMAVMACFFICSCIDNPVPRPYGYFRVDLPAHDYTHASIRDFPFSFDVSTEAMIIEHNKAEEKYWLDIQYPSLNATIYCSYKPVRGNLFSLSEDTRNIVYKHTVRAESIYEIPYEDDKKRVYAILYELTGNTASPVQFILTDSTEHFFRGALYFEHVPNKDSIAPMAHYVKEDIVRLIESFEWKKKR